MGRSLITKRRTNITQEEINKKDFNITTLIRIVMKISMFR